MLKEFDSNFKGPVVKRVPWAIQGNTLKGKGKYICTCYEFWGVGEKFEQMKFLAAIFEMQIMKRITLFSFQNLY